MGSVIRLIQMSKYDNIEEKIKSKKSVNLYSHTCLSNNKNIIPKKNCSVPWKHNEEYIT